MGEEKQTMHCDPFSKDQPSLGEAVIAIGIFDGLHIGHRTVFAEARRQARESGIPFYAVTFAKDPDEIFRKDDPTFGKLLENGERISMIAGLSDGVVVLPATQEVFNMRPEEFLEYLDSIMEPRYIFTGENFRFGHKAQGTGKDVESWAESKGHAYKPCRLIEVSGKVISSSRIRDDLRQGKVSQAKYLLEGRPHSLKGRVVHGRGKGEGFGIATANLDLSGCDVMLPADGVYGAYAVVDGVKYPSAVNVGAAKTFEDATALIEAHLLDFDGDLYGKETRIEFEEWLRPQKVFESQEELVSTINGNIDWVREHLGRR